MSSDTASTFAYADRSSVARASCRVELLRGPVISRLKDASLAAYTPCAASRYIVHTRESVSSNAIVSAAFSRSLVDATLSPRFHCTRNLACETRRVGQA